MPFYSTENLVKKAFTELTANFTVPAVGSNVTVSVVDSEVIGGYLFIETAGYYLTISKPSSTQIQIQNLGTTGNAAAGSTIASGAKIFNAGKPGINGADGDDGTTGPQGEQGEPGSVSAASTLKLTEQSSSPTQEAGKTLLYVDTSGDLLFKKEDGTELEINDWNALTNKPSTFAPSTHNHSASEINSGMIATARLGSGTANNTTFLRGDGTWTTPSGGGIPSWQTQTLTHSSNGDTNGLFYFIGTKYGAASWINPQTLSEDPITISFPVAKIWFSSGIQSLVDRNNVSYVVTNQNVDGDILWLDLGANRKLKPTKLTYQQRHDDADGMNSFVFYGTNVFHDFSTLSSLASSSEVLYNQNTSYTVTSNTWYPFDISTTNFYRYFAIKKLNGRFFAIAEIELYGELLYRNYF